MKILQTLIYSPALVMAMLAFLGSQTLAAESDEYPKYSTELQITSHGSRLPALFYGAAGVGPHPTVILLHGYPGNEKNLDVAQGLRAAGWNVLFFHYRGAWGAEGEFGFLNAEADVLSVIDYLKKTDNAQSLHVDTTAISLVGHSMGGVIARLLVSDANLIPRTEELINNNRRIERFRNNPLFKAFPLKISAK